MKKLSKIFLPLLMIAPMIIGCGGKKTPVHVHSYDELGFCSCGEFQEVEGLSFIEVGKDVQAKSTEAGAVELFKIHGAPGHKFVFSIQFYFNIKLVEWIDGGEVNKVENPTTSTVFEASELTVFYVKAEAEEGNKGDCHFRYAWAEAPTHTPDEKGICECGSFVGKTLQVSVGEDKHEANLAYLTTYNVYGEGIDWYRFEILEGDSKFYIGGTKIATRHTLGLWNPAGEKISGNGYSVTINDPAAGWYILCVTKSAQSIDAAATLHVTVTR